MTVTTYKNGNGQRVRDRPTVCLDAHPDRFVFEPELGASSPQWDPFTVYFSPDNTLRIKLILPPGNPSTVLWAVALPAVYSVYVQFRLISIGKGPVPEWFKALPLFADLYSTVSRLSLVLAAIKDAHPAIMQICMAHSVRNRHGLGYEPTTESQCWR